MSVLLTATRKAVKPKSAKPKKKKAPKGNGASTSATPPVSTDRTKVWHWELEGEPITVMYNKDRREVWCNGEIMDLLHRSMCQEADEMEFYIITDDNNVHKGKIKSLETGDPREPLLYQLYVNGYMIMEHNATPGTTSQNVSHFSPFEQDFSMAYGASSSAPAYDHNDAPPSYYDSFNQFKKDN